MSEVRNGFATLTLAELDRLRRFARRAIDATAIEHIRCFTALLNEVDAVIESKGGGL